MKCGSRAMRATRSSGHIRDQNVLLGFSLHRDHTQSHTAHSHTRLLETADRHRGVGGANVVLIGARCSVAKIITF